MSVHLALNMLCLSLLSVLAPVGATGFSCLLPPAACGLQG